MNVFKKIWGFKENPITGRDQPLQNVTEKILMANPKFDVIVYTPDCPKGYLLGARASESETIDFIKRWTEEKTVADIRKVIIKKVK